MSSGLTEDVDVHGGSGTAAAVGGLDDVGGAVVSLGLGDGDGGVSWLGVDGHSVVWFEDQVGLGPFHPGLGLTHHFRGEFDLAAGLGSQTGQQLGVQLNFWRLCVDKDKESQFRIIVILLKILPEGKNWLYILRKSISIHCFKKMWTKLIL